MFSRRNAAALGAAGLILLLLSWGCSGLRSGEQVLQDPSELSQGTILEAQGSRVDREQVLRLLEQSDYIILGEGHTNPCDHRVQAEILQLLAGSESDFALGLEMVPSDKQDVLQEFNQGRLGLEELEESLQWQKIWGHDYSWYQPVLQTARQAGIPVYGLNVPQKALQELKDKGLQEMSRQQRQDLPQPIIHPAEDQEQSLRQEYQRHENFLQGKSHALQDEERFILVQSVWDSQMAQEAIKVHKTGLKVLILAGSRHARKDRGIAHRIRILDNEPRILSLIPWRGSGGIQSQQGDLFFYCPQMYASRLGFVLRLKKQEIQVQEVRPDSRAARAGFEPGDVLLKAGEREVQEIMDLHHAAMQGMKQEGALVFKVRRQGQELQLELDF
ncbi:MAG: ChaN family lipoprotein [Desulfohalobiaceae bacterium]